jgi:hypothetical protein
MPYLSRKRPEVGIRVGKRGCYSYNSLCFIDISVFEADFVPQRGKAFSETAGYCDRAMASTGTSDPDGQVTTPLSLE